MDPPMFEELEEAIKMLKNNKAPGADGITAELFKQGGTELKKRVFWLILCIWVDEELPHHWNFGIICPILKKGDPMACSNYRGTLLLNPYPTAFLYGNGMVLHFYQQQESSTTKTVHKVINRGLKAYV